MSSVRNTLPSPDHGSIVIRGAREHNLKSVDLKLPRNRLIVITGLSGSGKSSLAFDTLYAEGQRRYVESLSAYARQFLERLEKPDVESIEGLSPAIAIEQRSAGGNPRSTVATQTEIYDYLRVLFARLGAPHCPRCRIPISRQSAQEMVARALELPAGTDLLVLAPLVRGRKGEYAEVFRNIKQQGFVRARVDGVLRDLDEPVALDKKRAHTIEVLVDRLTLEPDAKSRLTESVETALKVGKGIVILNKTVRGSGIGGRGKNKPSTGPHPEPRTPNDLVFSELYACPACGFSFEELSPRLFSFNSPYGACQSCDGLGTKLKIDPELVVPDRKKSLREGAIVPWKRGGMHLVMYYNRLLREAARFYGASLDAPFQSLERRIQRALLYGSNDRIWGGVFEGTIPNLERRFRTTDSDYVKEEIAKYMSVLPCPACRGGRLRPESLAVLVGGRSIAEATTDSVAASRRWFAQLRWTERERAVAEPLMKEIAKRLQFLLDVGLGYLTLDRASASLSGGEAQRIRLATQVGSGLVGVLYILDEPSIGLHQRDNEKLLNSLERLRDAGNTLVVVEHDEATIRRADYIVDLGPGAGKHGGEVVARGTLEDILASERSLTGQFLNRRRSVPIPAARRAWASRPALTIHGAAEHNLRGIDVTIPLGCFVCVTGVSGSGKSTLIDEILYRALARRLSGGRQRPGRHERITGIEHIDQVIVIDQSPIGRTPRSNPATYTGAFGPIRDLFSQTPAAKLRGFQPGRFSFNVKGGRCEACEGDGITRIEMHFLSDVYVRCEVCRGRRFNEQTLQVTYKGRSIADVLAMTAEEALGLFGAIPAIARKLETIQAVGLGYLELGQSATTLSGGEAQRIKLSKELSRRSTGRTLYLLDEPTTGLHFADVENLLGVLHQLVEQGNTVVVIEHNLDVVKTADYLIDLGPEGGEDGGRLVAAGSPEEVAAVPGSWTGQFLRPVLEPEDADVRR
ncbi:MAG: excinuclease ABC subunit A [Omnitrophica WOR_2 bacterium RIFCSPHIGHO2_02_FULL_68_15]|nr:MAG: excinuclease ABC subunit A [Omnitrophica WOR_2 bacterium RIFCSPHIGHO2_02_FULL_68_15]